MRNEDIYTYSDDEEAADQSLTVVEPDAPAEPVSAQTILAQMGKDPDAILRELLKDPLALEIATKMVGGSVLKSVTKPVSVKLYKEVVITMTCLHCGSKQTLNQKLDAGDRVHLIDAKGKVKTIEWKIATEAAKYETTTRFCSSCSLHVQRMDRIELEARYLELLRDINRETLERWNGYSE